MDNQKVLFYFLIVFLTLLFITTFSNIYNNKVNEINEGFQDSTTNAGSENQVNDQLSESIKRYIDNRLENESEAINRIRDTNSRLDNISERLNMIDESFEKADAISKNYDEFHSNYQTMLEEILTQKFNTDSNKFDVNNRLHAMRLEKIKEDLQMLDEIRKDIEQVDESSPNATVRGQSLRAMSDGSRLNFEYVVENGVRTNKIIISVNNGCLAFGDELDNGVSIMSLNTNCAERRNRPTLHFEIHSIKSYTEYNSKINYVNDGTKLLVSPDDEITYPFMIISPTLHFGHCVDLKDGILKIVPCTNTLSQRFQISNSQVLGECPVDVN